MITRYTIPTDSEHRVGSLSEFETALLHHAAELLALEENETVYDQATVAFLNDQPLVFPDRVNFLGSCIDELIPGEKDHDDLLVFVLWNTFYFVNEPEDYDTSNAIGPNVVVHENIYREMMAYLEEHWTEVMAIANYLKDHPGRTL